MEKIGIQGISQGYAWIVEILFGILILALVTWGLKRLIQLISRRYAKRAYDWRSKLTAIFYTPLKALICLLGAAYMIDILGTRFGFSAALNYLSPFRSASIVGTGAWMLLRLKNQFHHAFVARTQMGQKAIDPATAHVLGRLSSIAIGVIAVLLVLQILGLNIGPLLAFGGVGAAAIGFAARDVIANFFGGLMIHVTRPFSVGDVIQAKGKELSGVVEEIGWYLTTIRAEDKQSVYVPNSLFSNTFVVNLTRRSHRTFNEVFSIRFSDSKQVEDLIQDVKKMVQSHPVVDSEQPFYINLSRLKGKEGELQVHFHMLETRLQPYMQLKQNFLFDIQAKLDSKPFKDFSTPLKQD